MITVERLLPIPLGRSEVPACDAAFVALAEGLGGELVTCDGKLAAAPGNTARIYVADRR